MAMPKALTDPDKLAAAVEAFFSECESSRIERDLKNGGIQVRYRKPATVAGLAVYLGISRATLYRYMTETECTTVDGDDMSRDVYNTIRDILARARDRIEALTVEGAISGDYDSKTASLILGGMGYSSKTEDSPTVTVRIVGADAAAVDDWSR